VIGLLLGAEGELGEIDRAQDVERVVPDLELIERPRRRRFTAEYKLEILRQADGCAKPGEVGVLLRRAGAVFVVVDGVASRPRQRCAAGALSAPAADRRLIGATRRWRRCAAAQSAPRRSYRRHAT
jgi:hypothetical protein